MAFNNNDQIQHIEQMLQTWEDEVKSMEHAVRRLKSKDGVPVVNMNQLGDLDPQAGEGRFVKKVFDRFDPRIKSKNA